MRTQEREPLGRYLVERPATEQQLAFEWSRIKKRLDGGITARVQRATPVRVAFGACAVAVAVAFFFGATALFSGGRTGVDGDPGQVASEGAADGARNTVLADGSRMTVASGGRVRIVSQRVERTQIQIDGGTAEFDVTHRAGRAFVVSAAGVDVRVVGTRFRVSLDDGGTSVRVAVSRGAVEVMTAGQPAAVRVAAGQERVFGGRVDGQGWGEVAPPAAGVAAAVTETGTTAELQDVQGLFERANRARRAGRAAEAAGLYDVLAARFPTDRRAGLAALEAGRLRMDALSDLRAAAETLRLAVRLIPTGSLHEDALARLVDALDGLRDVAGCRRARADYLQRYQRGVHAVTVHARCAAR